MPEHTISENLARLQQAKSDIASAITTMGGTVNSGDGFEEFPDDIATIPSGAQVFNITAGSGSVRSCDGYGFFDGSTLVLCGLLWLDGNYSSGKLIFPHALSYYGFDPPEGVSGSYMSGEKTKWKSYTLSGGSNYMDIAYGTVSIPAYQGFCGIWRLST